jgi:predicted metalloendopeptidase
MDEPTRKEALVKFDALGLDVGYPDWILDQEKLDEYYVNVSVPVARILFPLSILEGPVPF